MEGILRMESSGHLVVIEDAPDTWPVYESVCDTAAWYLLVAVVGGIVEPVFGALSAALNIVSYTYNKIEQARLRQLEDSDQKTFLLLKQNIYLTHVSQRLRYALRGMIPWAAMAARYRENQEGELHNPYGAALADYNAMLDAHQGDAAYPPFTHFEILPIQKKSSRLSSESSIRR